MRCSARRSSDGQPCGQWARRGGTVCNAHGGRAPQVKAKAQRRLTEAKAIATLRRRGWEPVTDPLSALADLAGEVTALKDLLAERIEHGGGAAEVAAYGRVLDQARAVLTDLGRLKVDERLQRITQAQADAMTWLVTTLLDDLRLAPDDHAWARERAADLLLALGTGQVPPQRPRPRRRLELPPGQDRAV